MQSVCEATKTNTYNGWTNRETWVVNLWLTNEECYYYQLCEIIKNNDTVADRAEELESYVQLLLDVDGSIGMNGDLLSTALGRVNWYEIADNNQE